MLNNIDPKSRVRPSVLGGAVKHQPLSLNLHTMPQTVTSHWKKWLVLGLVVLVVFALISFLLYIFTQ
jgi:hypothetical protein